MNNQVSQNSTNDIRSSVNYQIPSRRNTKMTLFNRDPESMAKTFSQYIKAAIQILSWAVVGIAALAATCVVLSGIWIAAKFILKIIRF